MRTLIRYVQNRYFCKKCGFGPPWFRWLWLDALCYGVARYCTLLWPGFRLYCWRIDRIFRDEVDWAGSYTTNTGLDSWIDHYWSGESPEDAFNEEVSYWDE